VPFKTQFLKTHNTADDKMLE